MKIQKIILIGFILCAQLLLGCGDCFEHIGPPIIIFGAGEHDGFAIGGRVGADALCAAAKPAEVSQRRVRAFITVSASDQIRDMPRNYGVPTNVEVLSPNGTTLSSNWGDLLDGSIDVTLLAAGVRIDSFRQIFWSGSQDDGSLSPAPGATCVGWSGVPGFFPGVAGQADLTTSWLGPTSEDCSGAGLGSDLICIAFEY
ncbi:hypothetical protein ACFLRA_01525 [Bdellovibrionota bacterium]